MGMIKNFRVKGQFRQGSRWQTFTRELPALSRKQALERIYCEIGSKHRVKRNLIHILEVVELKPNE